MLFGWEQTLKNQLPKKLQKTLSTIKVQVREKNGKNLLSFAVYVLWSCFLFATICRPHGRSRRKLAKTNKQNKPEKQTNKQNKPDKQTNKQTNKKPRKL